MQFQDIVLAFLTVDITNMTREEKVALIRKVAGQSGLTTNQVTNLLRGKRNDYREQPVDMSAEDAAVDIAQRATVVVALFKARRCYHAQFGR